MTAQEYAQELLNNQELKPIIDLVEFLLENWAPEEYFGCKVCKSEERLHRKDTGYVWKTVHKPDCLILKLK